MANPDTASNDYDSKLSKTMNEGPLPFRSCIPLEGVSQAPLTSSIDAEWETLSVAPTQESALQTVSARPRFETLPGLGADSERAPRADPIEWTTTLDAGRPESSASVRPTLPRRSASKPRRSRRFVSILATTLSISFAIFSILMWRSNPAISDSASLALNALSIQPNLVAAPSDPAPPPTSTHPRPLPSAAVLAPEVAATASKADPPPVSSPRKAKPVPRSILASAQLGAESPASRLAAASGYRARQGKVVASDNPY